MTEPIKSEEPLDAAQKWQAVVAVVREVDAKNTMPPIADESILPIVLAILRAAGEPVHRSHRFYTTLRCGEEREDG